VTAYDDFLASPVAVRERGNWLAELHLEDDTDTEEVLRYSSRGFATAPGDTPANTNYPRRVIDGPRIETSLWRRGQIGGGSVPSFGTIKLSNMDGGLDQYHPSTGYRWDGRQITILYGEGKGWTLEMDYADFGVPFEGRMGEPIYRSDGTVEVPLKGLEDQFEDPLSERVYRGTDWLLEWSVTGIAPFGAVTTTKLDITGDITIEGWLYLDTFSTGGGIYTTAGGGATLKPWGVVVTSTRELRFNYTWNSGTNVNHTMTAVMGTKKWYHWAIRVDGTAGTFLLWDEDAQTETVETFTAASATRDGADGNCQLGSPSGNTTWHDEFRLWNDARDLDFIRANRHSELDTVPAACVHYLKFNEGTGTTVSDSAASPINSSTLTGTYQWLSALEGQADLAGTAKPDAFGRVYNVTPVLVDAATYTYQVAGAGEIEDIVNVYEGGNDLTRDTAQTDLRTFVTTTPTAGQYDSLDLHGLIKLGSKPTLPITVKVKGYLNASSTYVESAATIARHIVTDRGDNPLADPGDLDTASFTALETANDSIVGLYVSNPTGTSFSARSVPGGGMSGAARTSRWPGSRRQPRPPITTLTRPPSSACRRSRDRRNTGRWSSSTTETTLRWTRHSSQVWSSALTTNPSSGSRGGRKMTKMTTFGTTTRALGCSKSRPGCGHRSTPRTRPPGCSLCTPIFADPGRWS
jgi:hypothetical protein